jgi:hypothetical protein
MKQSDYADTRLVARLPHLDIEVLHRRQCEGEEQQLLITGSEWSVRLGGSAYRPNGTEYFRSIASDSSGPAKP